MIPELEEVVTNISEEILEEVDYDSYKEDLEEREIINMIEYKIRSMLSDICDSYSLDDLLEYIQRG